jgi:hypothetical protein
MEREFKMMKWLKWLLSTEEKTTPDMDDPTYYNEGHKKAMKQKFPRLKTLDSRIAAARGIEFDKDAM